MHAGNPKNKIRITEGPNPVARQENADISKDTRQEGVGNPSVLYMIN